MDELPVTEDGFLAVHDDDSQFLIIYTTWDLFGAGALYQSVANDVEGIGYLVEMGVERGRRTRPDLKVGICGEHGADARSVKFFARAGLDYVSASPYRVPLARLAAALDFQVEPGLPQRKLVQLGQQFEAKILIKQGEKEASADSVLALLLLEGNMGKHIVVTTEGKDAEAALLAVEGLINQKFDEK